MHCIEHIKKIKNPNVTKLSASLRITRGGVCKIIKRLCAKSAVSSYRLDENKKEAKALENTDEDEEIEVVVEDVDRENSAKDEKEDIITEEVSSAPQETISDVLETQVGSLSGYGPDCVGCSGFLASGIDVRNGNIYYSDSTYGNVRILAGDRSYPYGTIVRVKGSRLSEFIGIVLDRGGAVGFGKSHLFDLLYKSSAEALKNEVSYNTTFEILRYGY